MVAEFGLEIVEPVRTKCSAASESTVSLSKDSSPGNPYTEKNEMASAKKSQLFKFKELPPYPTHLVEEMANHIFISVYIVWKWLNSSTSLD